MKYLALCFALVLLAGTSFSQTIWNVPTNNFGYYGKVFDGVYASSTADSADIAMGECDSLYVTHFINDTVNVVIEFLKIPFPGAPVALCTWIPSVDSVVVLSTTNTIRYNRVGFSIAQRGYYGIRVRERFQATKNARKADASHRRITFVRVVRTY